MFVCSPEHPLAPRDSVGLHELDGLAMVGFDEHLRIRNEIDKTLAEHSVRSNVVMEFDNIETLKRAIEINAGVSLLPAPTVSRELAAGTLSTAHLDVSITRPLGIIRRRGADLGKTTRCFLQLLRQQPVAVGAEHEEMVEHCCGNDQRVQVANE